VRCRRVINPTRTGHESNSSALRVVQIIAAMALSSSVSGDNDARPGLTDGDSGPTATPSTSVVEWIRRL